MARVAAIYDVHGNLPALEAVLADIRSEGVDQIVVGGDLVPGPMPRETVSTLLDLSTPVEFIRGNGESDLLALYRGEGLVRVPDQFHDVMRWVADELPTEHRSAFAEWPLTVALDINELGRVMFCHATPRDDNEIFTRLTPEDRLLHIFEPTGADLVVCGHTHMQFDRMVGAVRVVNAGSVGMPFGVAGAYWLLLSPDVELRRTEYDLAAADGRIRATNYPQTPAFQVLSPPDELEMLAAFEDVAVR